MSSPANSNMDDEAAAHVLTSLVTPTTATFQHLRNLSLDDQGPANSSRPPIPPATHDADSQSTHYGKGKQRVRDHTFSMLDRLLEYDDILLYLTTQHMEPQELFALYCISKAFHYIVNSHMTNYILSSARRWARLTHHRPSNDLPEPSTRIKRHPPTPGLPKSRRFTIEHQSASRRALRACGTEPTPPGIYSNHDITTLLPFHNYFLLCTMDPTSRIKTKPLPRPLDSSVPTPKLPLLKKVREIRHVPTFRYLAMLLHRCQQIHSIVSSLLSHGHRLPVTQTPSVLAKMSYVLDLPSNNGRLALFRNEKYFSNTDLYVMMMFCVKLDMCFTDPVDGDGEVELRPLLLQQRSLKVMDDVLARRDGRTIIEIMQIWVRTYYRPPPGREKEFEGLSVLGVPYEELGMLNVEGWGQPVKPVIRPSSDEAQAGSSPPPTAAQNRRGKSTADDGNGAISPGSAATPASITNTTGSAAPSASHPSSQRHLPAQRPQIRPTHSNNSQSAPPTHPTPANHPQPPSTNPNPNAQPPPPPQPPPQPPLQPHQPTPTPPNSQAYTRPNLLPPDTLLIGESIRRQLPLHQKVLDMMLYGWVDVRTGEDLPMSQREVEERWERRMREEQRAREKLEKEKREKEDGRLKTEFGVEIEANEEVEGELEDGMGEGRDSAKEKENTGRKPDDEGSDADEDVEMADNDDTATPAENHPDA